MTIPLIDRDPTALEVEKFRLILSTYQDGSGQLAAKGNLTLPGWRDFERTVAATFGGESQENKLVFDVLLFSSVPGIRYGISCKMRRTLDDTMRTGRVMLELSNSAGKFWKALDDYGLNQQNYKARPMQVGQALLNLVRGWHQEVSLSNGGSVEIEKSCYLALSWNKLGNYQLFKFQLELPRAEDILWDFPLVEDAAGNQKPGRRLRGQDKQGVLFEWYGESGGQLKYYPLVADALWKSEIFSLEPLPQTDSDHFGIIAKARSYFPERWSSLSAQS